MAPKTLSNLFFILCILCAHTIGIKINNFIMPIEWHQVALSGQHSSMSTILDASGSVYLCGGKISLFSKSSKCVRIDMQKLTNSLGLTDYFITQTFSGGNGIKSDGAIQGLYFLTKSFTSSSQNEGGTYDNRLCMLSMSDGSNVPKSWCCDISQLNDKNSLQLPSHLNCDDLRYPITNSSPQRFDSCVIHDTTKNMLYQIGGYYGQTIFDTILCFDLETETYVTSDACNYGNLNTPTYGLGCTVMSDDKSTIITVGGLDTLSMLSSTKYSWSINICNSDKTTCQQLSSLSLAEGILKPRVFAIDSCHIGIVGGMIQIDGSQIISSNINIANICTQTWIYNDILPIPLSEMGVIKTNGVLCLYGGISFDENTQLPLLSQSAYCTNLGNGSSDTNVDVITTEQPTLFPTSVPSYMPSRAPLPIGQTIEPTSKTTQYLDDVLSTAKMESIDNLMIWVLFSIIGGFIVLLFFALLCVYKMKMKSNNVNRMVEEKKKHIELNKICHVENAYEQTEDSDESENRDINRCHTTIQNEGQSKMTIEYMTVNENV